MKKLLLSFATITAVTLMLCSCGHMRKNALSPRERFPELYEPIDELYSTGDTNGLITHLSAAMKNPKYETEQPEVLRFLIGILCNAHQYDRAETEFLLAVTNCPTAASATFGYLNHQYLYVTHDTDRALAWNSRLLAQPLPENLVPEVYNNRLAVLSAKGDTEQLKTTIDTCISKFDEHTSARILSRLLNSLIRKSKLDEASSVVDIITSKAKDSPLLRATADSAHVSILVARQQWPSVEKLLADMASRTEDNLLTTPFSRAASSAMKAERWATVDKLCEVIVNLNPEKPLTKKRAASIWVDSARRRGTMAEVPARLVKLESKNLPVDQLASLVYHNFYIVLNCGNRPAQEAMLKFTTSLTPRLTKENDIEQFSVFAVDGAFMLGNYDRAIQMLEAGVPGKSERWHKMAISKLKAHRALKSGDKKEAIRFFRQFMGIISQDTEDKTDPVSNISHSKEWTLGFNAKRIGDLYISMKDKNSAEKAYAEARDYYLEALEKAPKKTPESKKIQEEMSQLPSAKAK